jgi:AcrR family transcriptional regulator
MGQDGAVPATRTKRYHHGNLTNALTDAATRLARTGGPEAVVLREAARQVGVSATAAYRHFAGHAELIHAVKVQSQAALAARMEAELAATPSSANPAETALRRLRAIGVAYVRFALSEPGLFRTAFCRTEGPQGLEATEIGSFRSYQLLSETLDDLTACGQLHPSRRPFAEIAAWSAVHGLSLLLLDGPLARLPGPVAEQAIARTIEMVVEGLSRD